MKRLFSFTYLSFNIFIQERNVTPNGDNDAQGAFESEALNECIKIRTLHHERLWGLDGYLKVLSLLYIENLPRYKIVK